MWIVNLLFKSSTQQDKQTDKIERYARTCVALAFLHIALPECFWFGNLLTEVVWHYSRVLVTHAVDLTQLLTPAATHGALQSHAPTQNDQVCDYFSVLLFITNVPKARGESAIARD